MHSRELVRTAVGGCALLAFIATGRPARIVSPAGSATVSAAPQVLGHIHVLPPESTAALDGLRTKIQHVVYILKENRSFDNYFGTFPGAEGATSGTISTGETVRLGH